MTTLHFGRASIEVSIAAEQLVAVHRRPTAPPQADPAAAVRDAWKLRSAFRRCAAL